MQESDRQTNAFISAARWSKRGRRHKKQQLSGNEERGLGGLSGGRMFLYEQGGSSDGLRGLQGGTVLRERKAKMEGS